MWRRWLAGMCVVALVAGCDAGAQSTAGMKTGAEKKQTEQLKRTAPAD